MIVGLFPTIPIATAGEGSTGVGYSAGGSSIADRELARRLERVRQAEEEILEGDKLYADGDLEAAIAKYSAALDKLPKAPMTQEARDRATASLADATVEYAHQLATNGRRPEARQRLEFVLSPEIAPDQIRPRPSPPDQH